MGAANLYNFSVVWVAALGSFTYGFASAIIASIYGISAFYEYFGLSLKTGNSYTASIIGSINGLFYAGGVVGSLAVVFDKRVGRVVVILIAACLCIVGAAIAGAAVHIAMYIVGRFVQGAGSGMLCTIVPTYQSELSPARQRGRLVGVHAVGLVLGYAVAGYAGYGCYFAKNAGVQWRLLTCLTAVAPIFLLGASPWLPESPRWLILHDKPEKALEILQKLHHTEADPNDLLAKEEHLQISKQVELDSSKPSSLLSLITIPSYRKRTIIAIVLEVLFQSTGVQVVNNYQVLLYNNLGLYGSLPLLLYAIYATYAGVLNFSSTLILDKIPRRRVLSIGITGCGVSIVLLMAMIARFGGTSNRVGNGFGVFFLFCFITFYAFFLDCVSYVYITEIFPNHIRSKGLAVSISTFLATALVYTEVSPIAFANIGWKYYLPFIVISFLGAAFVWFVCPETNGLALEEIGHLFGEQVALDITHMSVEEKTFLDSNILKGNEHETMSAANDQKQTIAHVEDVGTIA